jgi:hypothetical protein
MKVGGQWDPSKERPLTTGPDSGPEPPFPIRLNGKVIKGFGRGSSEVRNPLWHDVLVVVVVVGSRMRCGAVGACGSVRRWVRRMVRFTRRKRGQLGRKVGNSPRRALVGCTSQDLYSTVARHAHACIRLAAPLSAAPRRRVAGYEESQRTEAGQRGLHVCSTRPGGHGMECSLCGAAGQGSWDSRYRVLLPTTSFSNARLACMRPPVTEKEREAAQDLCPRGVLLLL